MVISGWINQANFNLETKYSYAQTKIQRNIKKYLIKKPWVKSRDAATTKINMPLITQHQH